MRRINRSRWSCGESSTARRPDRFTCADRARRLRNIRSGWGTSGSGVWQACPVKSPVYRSIKFVAAVSLDRAVRMGKNLNKMKEKFA